MRIASTNGCAATHLIVDFILFTPPKPMFNPATSSYEVDISTMIE